MRKYLLLLLPVLFVASSCDPEEVIDDNPTVDFDRKEMLTRWVDEAILPGYADLESSLAGLALAAEDYVANPTPQLEAALRQSFRTAYGDYQKVSPFLIGKAEEIRLREQLNTYPADEELIEANLMDGNANLALPSNIDAQGFPALDYLIYGVDESKFTTDPNHASYRNYLNALIARMRGLTAEAAMDWTAENRQAFIDNDGNSATASIDRTVNDYIFYYEKFLRAGKVGIPAGIFSDDPLANRAEALYSGLSPELFAIALDVSSGFFNNQGLSEYLDAMEVERDGEKLSTSITNQFLAAKAAAEAISLPFNEQVETDNVKMLELYNELQRNVILLKVDMLQALSINVDYVDADGD